MDDKNKHKIDFTKLTPEQRDRLDIYNQAAAQIKSLKDIASMAQEIVDILDEQKTDGSKTSKEIGVLLVDMRDSLTTLNSKEQPDTSKVVVEAISKLESAISKAIKSIDVKPQVNVDAPQVNVAPTPVDLKGIEKILKTDIPAAFREAIGTLPPPEKDDYSPLLTAWEGISQQLLSIENATRMKPLPGTMKVTNPDGTKLMAGGTVSSLTIIGDSASSISLISANSSRKEVEFYNDSSAILYLLKDNGVASTSNFTVKLNQGDYYSTDAKTSFHGLWASDAGGSVYVTETL